MNTVWYLSFIVFFFCSSPFSITVVDLVKLYINLFPQILTKLLASKVIDSLNEILCSLKAIAVLRNACSLCKKIDLLLLPPFLIKIPPVRFKVTILRNSLHRSWTSMVIRLCLNGKQQRLVETSLLNFDNYNMLLLMQYAIVVQCSQVFVGSINNIDGCATFFRRDRFSHVKKYEVTKSPSVHKTYLRRVPIILINCTYHFRLSSTKLRSL